MPVTDLPIVGYYDKQRFKQFNPSDCANWYMVPSDLGKKKVAMYPTMGRKHVNFLNQNRLIFDSEPRFMKKSINYWYVVVNNKIFRIDAFFNKIEITASMKLSTISGNIFFSYIVVGDPSTSGSTTYVCFLDGQNLYIYSESDGTFVISTDPNTPKLPTFIATFGNRIVVSGLNSSTFILSAINLLGGTGGTFDPSKVFTISGASVFNQESGIIRQMGVLQNTLYIFLDYTTGIWSNIPSSFTNNSGFTSTFPWKKNTTYDFNYGIADPNTLDIDFGIMTWLAKNRNGLIQIMSSTGQKPEEISTKAIDVLLQKVVNFDSQDPLRIINSFGFLYDYENTVFYRLSEGTYIGTGLVDESSNSASLEYNFDTKSWHRVIEKNGELSRVKQHIFFGNRHFVTVQNDKTVFEMSGSFYINEITNSLQPNHQENDAYIQEPFRYERVTPIICVGSMEIFKNSLPLVGYYGEFITEWVEIDFVWGEQTFINSDVPFENAEFIVAENEDTDGKPVYLTNETDTNQFIVSEQGNFPLLDSSTYNSLYKPNIELLFSDDGGVTFDSADEIEFSQLGVYQWRMRWYQLGPSRNRVYKLICVSPAPIVILGANMNVRIVSDGAA